MPEIIDITPVSSHTSSAPPPMEPPSRWAESKARLRARFIALGVTLALVAIVVIVASVGLIVFFTLLGISALLALRLLIRTWVARARGTWSGGRSGPPARGHR